MKLLNQLTKIYLEKYDKTKFDKEPEFHLIYNLLSLHLEKFENIEDIKDSLRKYVLNKSEKSKANLMELLEQKANLLKIIIEESGGMIEDSPTFKAETWMIGVLVD